ncbi:hypothetical protein [Armatimonas sp.]|uniref:hypothetical protein n=1 Tax=Armatimonas sp. TaxID=1872638 RepID=UPI003750E5F6
MSGKLIWGLVPLLALALPLLAQSGKNDNPAKGYKAGKALLLQPFKMSTLISGLCRQLLPDEQKQVNTDIHFDHYAQVYVNAAGQRTAEHYSQTSRDHERKLDDLFKANPKLYWKRYGNQTSWMELPPFSKRLLSFPIGTVLVKEKFDNPQGKGIPELLTVMVKREKGYNPACYDWEFLVLEGKAERVLERGKLARCQSCHGGKAYKATDGVAIFSQWKLPLALSGSR